MLAISVTLPLLGMICVFLRVGQRLWRKKEVGFQAINLGGSLDEVFCVLALIPMVATGILIAVGAGKEVIGGHSSPDDVEGWITTVTPSFEYLEKIVYIVFIMQPLALGFIKLSFLFFYRRIFEGRTYRIISWALIYIVIGWTIAFFFGFLFDCQLDFAANWSSLANISEVCGFGFKPTIVFTILDALLDFIILLLPIPYVMRLQMPLQKKLEVTFVFLLGGFSVVAAIIRMTIYIMTSTPSDGLTTQYILGLPNYDVVGIISSEIFWTMVETGVAVIAACLPTIRRSLSNTVISSVFRSWASRISATANRDYSNTERIKDAPLTDPYGSAPSSRGSAEGCARASDFQKGRAVETRTYEMQVLEFHQEKGSRHLATYHGDSNV
ncbi:hypothetical protein PVAG01_00246 [Phlyctema vagabunda]|uniref:Rhodopsin domain-containing protein n=1 Tax=Phlyctema vagabunda TaxID=108571 RepID=A0ABR4PTN9_9HELO